MARRKHFIEANVLDEALRRIRHVYEAFDQVVVMFSGGKDSLVTLHLVRQVAEELGRLPVHVVFRDEELIPTNVIDLVESYREQSWVEMIYFATPLHSRKYILGVSRQYIQWDPDRDWIRPKPEHAVEGHPGMVYDQHTMDAYTAEFYRGRLAFVTGIRAAESLMRFRGVVNKLNENYITRPTKMGEGHKPPENVWLVKPIYDWQENDIFKFLYDRGIPYAPVYDAQLMAGKGLRVSTPLHAENAKEFHMLRRIDPVFYQQVIDLFPEMLVQERYWQQYDRDAIKREYGGSYQDVQRWVSENITDPEELEVAQYRLARVLTRARHNPEAYPPDHILTHFINGTFKREILPVGKRQ